MKLFVAFLFVLIVASVLASDKKSEKEKTKQKTDKKGDKMKGAESIYHQLPVPFVHYPYPFVNSYSTRYFPYSYAGGVGYGGIGGGYGGVGGGYGGIPYGGMGYGWGYNNYY